MMGTAMMGTAMRRITFAIVVIMLTLICAVNARAAGIRYGDTGETVKLIQAELKRQGYYQAAIDGIFGPKTLAAVEGFQRGNHIEADGVAGKMTLALLGVKEPTYKGYTEEDVMLLTRIINGEGRGESYTGKVAIGAVVMNRVRSPGFPDTIKGVIFERGAFAAVSDGQFYLTPYESCRRAAIEALNGADPTGGALFYWNPRVSKSSWVLTLTVLTDIGNHRFAVAK